MKLLRLKNERIRRVILNEARRGMSDGVPPDPLAVKGVATLTISVMRAPNNTLRGQSPPTARPGKGKWCGKYRGKLRLDFCSFYIKNYPKKGNKTTAPDILIQDNPLKPG